MGRIPSRARVVPGALVAVAVTATMVTLLRLPVATLEVRGLLDVIQPPSPGQFTSAAGLGLLVTVVAFTLIASAESLFSAAAVDRLHTGPRTDYDKELVAQGAGNTICGLLGALPMTAVIVRSAANVHAGARTKTSRVLHGAWLLLFAALLPAVLAFIPTAALAGVLIHAGFKLLPATTVARLWRTHRGEALVLLATATAIVTINMFEGVLIGLLLSVIKTAWETSRLHIAVDDRRHGPVRVTITGNATFLRLPKLLDTLEALPVTRPVELDLTNLRHLDHACHTALETWTHRHKAAGDESVQLIQTA
ncbi:SulP family inorganic anion transporter [Actinoplanes sp. ATCC 53533]|uniref:SulP family inorganic anion transporter n=1 Tax=Actinoplanes sp. ATCC 53533 TaxID=1288362 RepID=UPI0018F7041E|nr:SulP family inorganic anion transporter [Actinoplanes sp. ATCC 53533]